MKQFLLLIFAIFLMVSCRIADDQPIAEVQFDIWTVDSNEICTMIIGWQDDVDSWIGEDEQPPWRHSFEIERGNIISLNFKTYCNSGTIATVVVDGKLLEQTRNPVEKLYGSFWGMASYLTPVIE